MGLYDEIQLDIKEALNSDLLDAYKTFKITDFVSSIYDPETGILTKTENSQDCKCVELKNQEGDDLDNPESVSGVIFLVMDSDKPFDFSNGQKILYNGEYYKVKGKKTDPIGATWTLSCVAWN